MAQGKFKKVATKSSKGVENIKQRSIHRTLKQQEKAKARQSNPEKINSIKKIVNANLMVSMNKSIEKSLHSQASQHEGKSFNIINGKN
jgi:hypothetical protein